MISWRRGALAGGAAHRRAVQRAPYSARPPDARQRPAASPEQECSHNKRRALRARPVTTRRIAAPASPPGFQKLNVDALWPASQTNGVPRAHRTCSSSARPRAWVRGGMARRNLGARPPVVWRRLKFVERRRGRRLVGVCRPPCIYPPSFGHASGASSHLCLLCVLYARAVRAPPRCRALAAFLRRHARSPSRARPPRARAPRVRCQAPRRHRRRRPRPQRPRRAQRARVGAADAQPAHRRARPRRADALVVPHVQDLRAVAREHAHGSLPVGRGFL